MPKRISPKRIVLRSLIAAGFACLLSMSSLGFGIPLLATTEASAATGEPGREQFLAHKCVLCHGVVAAGVESRAKTPKMDGGDLSGYHTEDAEALLAFLRKQTEQDGEKHKREFKGSDEELQQILDWLGSMEAEAEEDSGAEDEGE